MAKFSTSDLYVVLFPHTDGYSYDTETPDAVFTSADEAQAYADELNNMPMTFNCTNKKHYVVSLYDRIDEIKDNARSAGIQIEHDQRSQD